MLKMLTGSEGIYHGGMKNFKKWEGIVEMGGSFRNVGDCYLLASVALSLVVGIKIFKVV